MNRLIYSVLFVLLTFSSILSGEVSESVVPLLEDKEWMSFYEGKIGKEQLEFLFGRIDESKPTIRVMSLNMLRNDPHWELNLLEKHRWPNRLPRLVEYLQFAKPDLIGSQELSVEQVEDLVEALDGEFEYYGEVRGDEEIEAVFYRKSRFNLIKEETIWFSDTPEVISKSHLGKYNAITSVVLQDQLSGEKLHFLNVHLSFGRVDCRYYEAMFLMEYIKKLYWKEHLILTGDFNTFPFKMDNTDYPFYDGDQILRFIEWSGMWDSKSASYFGHLGPYSSSAYTVEEGPFSDGSSSNVVLDHIFVRGPITVYIHAIDKARVNGEYISDHFPVIADIVLH